MALHVSGGSDHLGLTATMDTSQFHVAVRSIEADLKAVVDAALNQSGAIEGFAKKAAAALGSYMSLVAGKQIIEDIIRVRAEFQQLEVAFETMLGSKEKANKLMAEIAQFAASTPFELSEIAAATRSLLAFGLAADDIKPTLKALGDVSAGVGAPIREVAELYGKAKVQGRLFAEDVNQLTGRGIPIIQELAKQFGVADDKVRGLVESGKVGFPQIEKAFQSMTSEGGKFAGLMEAQSKTINGLRSNLSDAIDAMFNALGRSQEGLITNSLTVVISLVKNYQTVIDVLEVAVLTYGSYKAALLLTNVASTSLGVTTRGLTAAQILQAGASGVANKAMALLNRTMLANPAVALTTLIAGLVATMIVFRDETIEVKEAQELLADAQKNVGDRFAETQARLLPYLEALKNANLTEQQRVDIYNKIKEKDADVLKNLEAKTLSYENLKNNVDLYLNSLRNQLKLEANQGAAKESIKQEQAFQDFIDQRREKLGQLREQQKKVQNEGYNPYGGSTGGVGLALEIKQLTAQIETYEGLLKKQQEVTEKFGKAAAPPTPPAPEKEAIAVRNEAFIKAEIKRIQDLREPLAVASEEYKEYTRQIEKLQNELNPQKAQKAIETRENKINEILERKRSILEEIAGLQGEANLTGLTKEQQEVDRVRVKYEAALQKVVEFNAEKKNAGHQIGVGEILKLGSANAGETLNVLSRQESAVYIKQLESQKQIFEQYENSKKDIGLERANEMFAGQTKGFKTYLDYLQSEFSKIQFDGGPGAEEKRKKIAEDIVIEKNARTNAEAESYKNLLILTRTYNNQKAAINRKYDDLENTLAQKRSTFTNDEYESSLNRIKGLRQDELTDLNNYVTRQSGLYRRLNQDLISFSADAIRKEASELQKQLRSNTTLTPAMKADIQSRIDQLLQLVHNTDTASLRILKTSGQFAAVSNGISALSSSLSGINDELSETLSVLSNISGSVATALKSFDDFNAAKAANNIGGQIMAISGGISSAVSALSGVINLIGPAFSNADVVAFRKEIDAFNRGIYLGEFEINELYRQRTLEQARLNQLRLEGLRAESQALTANKEQVIADYEKIFEAIKKERYEKLIDVGALTGNSFQQGQMEMARILIGDRSFEEIAQLDAMGQLTEGAKAYFEQLKQLKEELKAIGVSEQQLEALKNETLTGTTYSSIVDSIADGFNDGFRSVEQFANKTEDIVRGAMLNALKYKFLEDPIKKIYEQFAKDAESGGTLDTTEMANFTANINKTIQDAAKYTAEIEKATGIALTNAQSANNGENSLQGAFKAMSQQSADLLAGQFGGLRLTNIEILEVANRQLLIQNKIEANTAATVRVLDDYFGSWSRNGLRVLIQ